MQISVKKLLSIFESSLRALFQRAAHDAETFVSS